MFERVRKAAITAIQAQEDLLVAWRDFNSQNETLPASDADAGLLHQLVWRKIYPLPAFTALVRMDRDAALTTLLRRYLGSGVNPDSGFGGFVFDLSSMLADLVEVGGEDELIRLITHPDFNRAMLTEPRFIESVCFAFDMELDQFPGWLSKVKKRNPDIPHP